MAPIPMGTQQTEFLEPVGIPSTVGPGFLWGDSTQSGQEVPSLAEPEETLGGLSLLNLPSGCLPVRGGASLESSGLHPHHPSPSPRQEWTRPARAGTWEDGSSCPAMTLGHLLRPASSWASHLLTLTPAGGNPAVLHGESLYSKNSVCLLPPRACRGWGSTTQVSWPRRWGRTSPSLAHPSPLTCPDPGCTGAP